MSAEENDGLLGEAGQAMEEGGLAEPVAVHDRSGWHVVRRISRLGLLILLGLALAALAALWLAREPIADRFLQRELERRGVQATYTLDRVGLRNQQISNLVIGDPDEPRPRRPRRARSRCGSSGTAASRSTASSRAASGCAARC